MVLSKSQTPSPTKVYINYGRSLMRVLIIFKQKKLELFISISFYYKYICYEISLNHPETKLDNISESF
jgi:hypothetical protein